MALGGNQFRVRDKHGSPSQITHIWAKFVLNGVRVVPQETSHAHKPVVTAVNSLTDGTRPPSLQEIPIDSRVDPSWAHAAAAPGNPRAPRSQRVNTGSPMNVIGTGLRTLERGILLTLTAYPDPPSDPFVSIVPARPPPPARPPSPPRICVSFFWVEPTPREPISTYGRAARHTCEVTTVRSPVRAFAFVRPSHSALRSPLSTYVRDPRPNTAVAGAGGARTGDSVVEPLRVQHGAESARPLLCGIFFPGPREREVGGGQHAWPDPLRSIWWLGVEVACLPVSGRDA
ncbi:hypothetical protein DFH09DRAFT_1084487 [Mycena vulgaris]|nr:hypothetical protein DFH09DRAFT_1108663 [Mycena vulgaris]KAJ6556785.1 hypothetical protein DFH09DRAFT_1084487 [Mycena vulgaris]